VIFAIGGVALNARFALYADPGMGSWVLAADSSGAEAQHDERRGSHGPIS
jgi:hypothetical protein